MIMISVQFDSREIGGWARSIADERLMENFRIPPLNGRKLIFNCGFWLPAGTPQRIRFRNLLIYNTMYHFYG